MPTSDPKPVLGASAIRAKRRLAIEYAHEVLDAPASTPLDQQVTNLRHLVLVLVHELEQAEHRDTAGPDLARTTLAAARARHAIDGEGVLVRCSGSGLEVPTDQVDGSGVTTCPVCKRFRGTDPAGGWRRIVEHRRRVQRSEAER